MMRMWIVLFVLLACRGAAGAEPGEIALFNGKNLDGWKVVDFGGSGEVRVLENGHLEIGMGELLSSWA